MGADSAHPGSGQATLINCTLTANIAQGGSAAAGGNGGTGAGGAIFNLDGTVTLTNDTVVGNSARNAATGLSFSEGAGVYQAAFGNDIDTGNPVAANLVLNNNILALNTVATGGQDLVSQVFNGTGTNTATVSGSHNLIMVGGAGVPSGIIVSTANPQLGPLQNNGGLTPTLLPQSGSPVLGAGDPSLAPDTDQRGHPRPSNGPTDLGSVQVSPPPSPSPSPSPSPAPPTLHKPPLLAFLDGLFHGVETVNANGTETVVDSIFGITLFVSTYDSSGNLMSVTLFGINITILFELL